MYDLSSGTIARRFNFGVFGQRYICDDLGVWNDSLDDLGLSYGYTSRRHDEDSGLMYFRARYYDSATGEFISPDPLEYVDGMSLYRGYFIPSSVDPHGKWIWKLGQLIWKHRAAALTATYVIGSGLTIYDFVKQQVGEGGEWSQPINVKIPESNVNHLGCNIPDPNVTTQCPSGKVNKSERMFISKNSKEVHSGDLLAKLSWGFRYHVNSILDFKFTDGSLNNIAGSQNYQDTRVAIDAELVETTTEDDPCQCCRDKAVAIYNFSLSIVYDDPSGGRNDFLSIRFYELKIDGQGGSKATLLDRKKIDLGRL